jgi:peptide deformylase
MALRNIVEEGDDILRKRAREVTEIDKRIITLVEDMAETMMKGHGVGIAAPQVGILKRIFLAVPDSEVDETPMVFINPEILQQEGSQLGEEGCLSVPGFVGTVERPLSVRLKALDINGNEKIYDFQDFAAVVICHEYDHLNGILYTDKAKNIHETTFDGSEELPV